MSQGSLLHRFQIELADSQRKLAESVDLRIARNSSEIGEYLVARVLAYCLCFERGIELAPDLCKADQPSLAVVGYDGVVQTWIEIGIPETRKLHRASKASKRLVIFPHRGPKGLPVEEPLHRGDEIEVIDLGAGFLRTLAQGIDRNNRWKATTDGTRLTVHDGKKEHVTSIERTQPFKPR